MSTLENPVIETLELPQIREIEQLRQSKVLIIAASMLEMTFLPELYNQLENIGYSEKLDVVLYGRGGEINAARRIALLLHQFCDSLTFIVPYYCESSCTILSLAGHQVIYGDLAIFSPIDPRMNAADSSDEDAPAALASEDIRLFCKMSQDWFDIKGESSREQLLVALSGSIFPTTLTSLYRSTLELRSIAEELIDYQLPYQSSEENATIVEKLLCGYHSHSYALTGGNLTQLGLNFSRDSKVEKLAWNIAQQLSSVIGGGARRTMQDPRNDVLLATNGQLVVRQRYPTQISPVWLTRELTT